MDNRHLVSVLMPAYNAEKYIGIAIDSILNQTYSNFEFIIVDDGSKDNTSTILRDYSSKDSRIKVITNPSNLKLTKSLNVGLKAAKGSYIVRMDADDYSEPARIMKQVAFMESNPNVGICGCYVNVCNEKLDSIYIRKYALSDKEIRKSIFFYNPFAHPAVIIRKSILDKIGEYDINYYPSEDCEIYFRLGLESEFANIAEVLFKYRLNESSLTSSATTIMERKAIAARYKYALSYHISMLAAIYSVVEYIATFCIPLRVRVWVFSVIRGKKN